MIILPPPMFLGPTGGGSAPDHMFAVLAGTIVGLVVGIVFWGFIGVWSAQQLGFIENWMLGSNYGFVVFFASVAAWSGLVLATSAAFAFGFSAVAEKLFSKRNSVGQRAE